MELSELTSDESILLAGMVRLMVGADGSRNDLEMAEFRAIGEEMGRAAFDEAFRRSLSAVHNLDEALALADQLERPAARQLIVTILIDLAQADGVDEQEALLVRALADRWGVTVRV